MPQPIYLWKISQNERDDYNTYDSAIVTAHTEDEARRIRPDSGYQYDWDSEHDDLWAMWATKLENVTAERIGIAIDLESRKVILASFNAG